MALAETIFVDKCEVVSAASTYCSGNEKVITLQIRKADVVEKDGVEIARSFHRHAIVPGTVAAGSTALTLTDISGEDPIVQCAGPDGRLQYVPFQGHTRTPQSRSND